MHVRKGNCFVERLPYKNKEGGWEEGGEEERKKPLRTKGGRKKRAREGMRALEDDVGAHVGGSALEDETGVGRQKVRRLMRVKRTPIEGVDFRAGIEEKQVNLGGGGAGHPLPPKKHHHHHHPQHQQQHTPMLARSRDRTLAFC